MKEKIRKVLLFICACVFVYSAYQLTSIFFEYNKIDKDTENLVGEFVEEVVNNEPQKEEKEEPKKIDPLERVVKFDSLLKRNSDVVGWIYIPDTNIDEPLVKGENNDSYLHMTVNKNKSIAGSIFIEETNNRNLEDSNTIIYGHNIKNGARFHNLQYYVKKDYYDAHPFVYIYLPDGTVNVYEVFASDLISAYSDFYDTHVDYKSFVKSVQKGASQKTTVSDEASPLIMLSTCYNSTSENRYVVFARLKENVKVN